MSAYHAIASVFFAVLAWSAQGAQTLPVERIRLPPGFEISVFSADVPGARSLAVGKEAVFVGTQGKGRVYAVRYKDGRATQVVAVASGLNIPNGVALHGGSLYVAEVNRVLRFDDAERRLEKLARSTPAVVFDRLPRNTAHGWKFIRFAPDGRLTIPVGAPCNVCEPDPERYAHIASIRLDPGSGRGEDYQAFARGVRNSVGFDWDPQTHELWFTDNGRDLLGDDLPSDELNHAPRAGLHFGFPYCHQGDTPDPQFGKGKNCSEFTPPAAKLGPHVAALGMRFYTGGQFPQEYRNNIFIAEHGSWNRSEKIGYRVVRVSVSGGRVTTQAVFAEGWLERGQDWGRPVDVDLLPDGSLLVSDDKAGAIYRISYRGK